VQCHLKSRLLTGTMELAHVFRAWSRKTTDIRIVTAWATMDRVVCDNLRDARSKISTMVVGLDFHSTSPSLLEDFWSTVRIGGASNGGTFHPKLYLFRKGAACCCVMGSSNFTHGGFGDNSELNICMEGGASDPFFREVSRYIDEQEKRSDRISSPIFDEYKDRYAAFRTARQRIEKFRVGKRAKARARARTSAENAGREAPDQLNRTWPEFVKLILAGKRRHRVVQGNSDAPSYLQTAERCRALFIRHKRLVAKMPSRDRQFVGGTINEAGWFGSMKGAGEFKQRLTDNPASLDRALRRIPLQGPVSQGDFDAFAARYAGNRAGVATGSRLLAMKRPDLFICVDSNRSGIANAFGIPAASLSTFGGYWELIQRISICPWWKSPAPKTALDRRIWNARVALLDSLYYVQ
jgi:hypothetical protein